MTLSGFQSRASELLPYHLREEWGDGRYQYRNGDRQGLHFDAARQPVAGRVLAGRFRPGWEALDAGPTVRNGRLEHDYGADGDGLLATACEQTIGEWSVSFQWLTRDTFPDEDRVEVDCIAPSPHADDRWYLRIESNGGLSLRLLRDGTDTSVIRGSWTTNTNRHTVTVTRDAASRWTLRSDGVSQGSAPYSDLPQARACALRFIRGAESRVAISNVEVR